MLTLGRLAALAASVERATRQDERARQLNERIELTREIHERVMQRLFGLLLALGSGEPLDARPSGARATTSSRRCSPTSARRSAGRSRRTAGPTCATLGRAGRAGAPSARPSWTSTWPAAVEVPGAPRGARPGGLPRGAPQLREARRRRSDRGPRWPAPADAFELEITNDGRRRRRLRGRRRARPAAADAGGAPARRAASSSARCRATAGTCGMVGSADALMAATEGKRRRSRCGCSSSTTTTSSTGAFACCSSASPGSSAAPPRPTAEEALELAERLQPDVALVDLFLGDESGAELTEELPRARRRPGCC